MYVQGISRDERGGMPLWFICKNEGGIIYTNNSKSGRGRL